MLVRSLVSSLMALSLVALSTASGAASRGIFGSLVYENPSVGGAFTNERGPYPFGTAMLATANTTAGGGFSIAANQVVPMTSMQFRLFPAFPSVAQLTATHTSTQLAATFMVGGGAAAGGDISWCPPAGNPLGAGNPACTFFLTPGAGNQPIRIGVNNAPAAPKFGGTLKVIRNSVGQVWFVPVLGTSMNPTAQVSKQPNGVPGVSWTPGLTNYRFIADVNDPGPNYTALRGPSGSITFLGAFVSTPPGTLMRFADGEAWGFQMTTGTVSGSDIFPQTTGTPMHFFFTRAGTDMRVATTMGGLTGNIVLVGGAIATSPSSGNLFDRTVVLNVNLPEPATSVGLCAGLVGLIGLAGAQRRSR